MKRAIAGVEQSIECSWLVGEEHRRRPPIPDFDLVRSAARATNTLADCPDSTSSTEYILSDRGALYKDTKFLVTQVFIAATRA